MMLRLFFVSISLANFIFLRWIQLSVIEKTPPFSFKARNVFDEL